MKRHNNVTFKYTYPAIYIAAGRIVYCALINRNSLTALLIWLVSGQQNASAKSLCMLYDGLQTSAHYDGISSVEQRGDIRRHSLCCPLLYHVRCNQHRHVRTTAAHSSWKHTQPHHPVLDAVLDDAEVGRHSDENN